MSFFVILTLPLNQSEMATPCTLHHSSLRSSDSGHSPSDIFNLLSQLVYGRAMYPSDIFNLLSRVVHGSGDRI